ncbi:MAG: tetratricopeptide repeat-containing sensor histidine kinase [Haliscomenobacter sp.]|uniref:tetratricopeptide repeat-containing sensor histidine kinase n=1 Tax=Haliscomenobacter sp. TaxID=2717303 RepID=UPI0029B81E93|nr:tetratricopeptide repeat-containing sensor histidine kinase [Haliscomenobacter sp.]MDX2071892.1 tetratricopeptide repeat-containing sensor histidine kinase [Haliscomenobacter sp.]
MMPKKRLLLYLLSLGFFQSIQAQELLVVDSLIQLLPKTTEDTARARLYKAIVDQSVEQPDKALHYANLGMKHVNKMAWAKGIGIFNGLIGRIYSDQGAYTKAKPYLIAELKVHQKNRDLFNIASSQITLGTLYLRQGQYSKALEEYLAALKTAEKSGQTTLLPVIYNNISTLYSEQNHFNKSLPYSRKALALYREIGDTLGIATTYSGIANQFQLKTDTLQAIRYYQKALKVFQTIDAPIKIAEVYQNQALLIKPLKPRLQLQLNAQSIWDQTYPAFKLSITNLGNIGWSFLDSAKLSKNGKKLALEQATYYHRRATDLANAAKDEGNQHFLLSLKAELEAAKGNYAPAFQAMYTYHAQHDSIFSQESKNKLAEAESNFFLEKKDAEIAIQKLTISNQRKIQWAFALGSLLLVLIAFLFYRLSLIRRKSNQQLQALNQSLDLANRQKAQLLAVLSHDLRHPLSNLIGLLHLQKNAPDLLTPELASQNQARITSNTEMLLENLENMLLWSKEQMNRASVEPQEVAVTELFDRLKLTFSTQDQIWAFDCPADFKIHSDPNYLWIVLQNLSSNASKAVKNQNDGKIIWKAWSEGHQKCLSITDNGPGFPAHLLSGSVLPQKEILLSGFGLQVVHDFAQKLGIALHFENAPEGGACVVLKMQ